MALAITATEGCGHSARGRTASGVTSDQLQKKLSSPYYTAPRNLD